MAEQGLRGLTLTQPWASLFGRPKRIETRSWTTGYRGLVAIHASKGFPKWARNLCFEEPFYNVLKEHGHVKKVSVAAAHVGIGRAFFVDGHWDFPLGAIVAVGELVDVRRTDKIMEHWRRDGFLELGVAFREPAFGDYSTGRYGWIFTDIKLLREPVPCTGALGLWAVPPEIAAQVFAQIKGVSPW